MVVLLEVTLNEGLILAYFSILIMALIPIWIGSHLSLTQKAVTFDKTENKLLYSASSKTESLSSSDAWKFPLIGSGVLFGFYIIFKIFSKEYVNLLLTIYFLFFGILAMASTFKPLVSRYIKSKSWKRVFNIPGLSEPLEIELDAADIVSGLIGLMLGIWYIMTKNWVANNIIGLAFSVQGIALLSLGSYSIGCTLLGGLFLYDIFWVFGTDVMVTVAKAFDAPVKLLFPRDIFAQESQYSMLGLGDIVIPGVFLALLLRFDAFRANKKEKFSKPYFLTTFIFYILGLFSTIFVMHTFQAAQPALLYLVPACIGSSFGLALIRREVKELLAYNEQKEDTTKNPKAKEN